MWSIHQSLTLDYRHTKKRTMWSFNLFSISSKLLWKILDVNAHWSKSKDISGKKGMDDQRCWNLSLVNEIDCLYNSWLCSQWQTRHISLLIEWWWNFFWQVSKFSSQLSGLLTVMQRFNFFPWVIWIYGGWHWWNWGKEHEMRLTLMMLKMETDVLIIN